MSDAASMLGMPSEDGDAGQWDEALNSLFADLSGVNDTLDADGVAALVPSLFERMRGEATNKDFGARGTLTPPPPGAAQGLEVHDGEHGAAVDQGLPRREGHSCARSHACRD